MATFRKRGSAWNVQVRRKGHEPVTATFDTKAQAEAWARDVEAEMDRGTFTSTKGAKDTTVQTLFERYAKEVSTLKLSGWWEVSRVKWFITHVPFMQKVVLDLAPDDLQRWRDKRLKVVSAATVNRDLNFISAVFGHAIKEWRLPLRQNPVSLVRRPTPPRARRQRWAEEDIQKIKVSCRYVEGVAPASSEEYVPYLVLLAVETAMRRGELVALRIEDVYLDKRYAHLRATKNGDTRDVPLSRAAVALLTTLIGNKKKGRLIPFSATHLANILRGKMTEVGLRHLHFHDTRREAATRMSKKLSNVLELAAVTGHKNLKYLQIYYNPDPTELADKLC